MSLIHCNLRVLMAEKNLNIQKVKDNTTLSRTTISNLYNNYGTGIQFDTLKQLCQLLECQPGDLFSFYDISTEFKEISFKDEFTLEETYLNFRNNNDIDQSKNIINTLFEVLIKYNRDTINFELPIKIAFTFEDEFTLKVNGTIDQVYKDKIKEMNIPFVVDNHIINQLENFVIESVNERYHLDFGYEPIKQIFDFNIGN